MPLPDQLGVPLNASSGTGVLHFGYFFDFDAGLELATGGHVRWNWTLDGLQKWSLSPWSSKLCLLGFVNFDDITVTLRLGFKIQRHASCLRLCSSAAGRWQRLCCSYRQK